MTTKQLFLCKLLKLLDRTHHSNAELRQFIAQLTVESRSVLLPVLGILLEGWQDIAIATIAF